MSTTIADLLTALEEKLTEKKLTEQELASTANFENAAQATDGAYFIKGAKLRFSKHFEPDFQAYLYDPSSGTLGLICAISQAQNADSLRLRLRQALEQASYLRFQTLSEASTQISDEAGAAAQPVSRPLSIELIFLLAAEEKGLRRKVTEQIASAVRQTEFLHAIGVALLEAERADSPDGQEFTIEAASLRRAMPWRLRSTQQWFGWTQRPSPLVGATSEGALALRQIELLNYRRPGLRVLTFHPDARVHLVHGHNGSGKSSVVEAIEYAMTGRIARLAGVLREKYQETIRYREEDGPAQITFRFAKGEPRVWEPGVSMENEALSQGLSPNAFRLDQATMSALLGSDKVARARVFVEAFFPEDAPRLKVAEEAKRAAEQSRKSLGERLLGQIKEAMEEQTIEAAVAKRLASLNPGTDTGQRIERRLADDLWPGLTPEVLLELTAFSPALRKSVTEWQKDPPLLEGARPRLKAMAVELREMHGKIAQTTETIREAREALSAANAWKMSTGSGSGDHFQTDLNAWLRAEAQADLKGKLSEALDCYQEARRDSAGNFGDAVEQLLQAAGPLRQTIAEEAALSIAERDRLCLKLQRCESSGAGPEASEDGPPPYLTDAKIRALDLAAKWLPSIELPESWLFGSQLNEALQQRRRSVGNLVIGKPGWAAQLIARLDALKEACAKLQALSLEALDGSSRLEALAQARELHAKASGAAEALSETFLRKLGVQQDTDGSDAQRLNAALNEIMALFTPSRWEYEDLQLRRTSEMKDAGEVGLDVTSGTRGIAADLCLNTAQMNIFAVALFLLCAIRHGNPLRLLILDDPLQNMDEVTVTTLARGLGKFARKLGGEWKKDENWRLLLLFHGEDDLQRFIDEIPEAEIHRLSWLAVDTPRGNLGQKPVETGRFGPVAVSVQTLNQIAEESSKS